MKAITIIFIAAFAIILFSCSKNDHSVMYGTYTGVHSAGEKSTSFMFSIEIKKDSLIMADHSGKMMSYLYKITSADADKIDFSAEIKHNEKAVSYNFSYNVKEQLLTLKDFTGGSNDIVLKTKQKFMEDKVKEYASFALKTDLSKLTANEKKMIPLLIEAADLMDEIYWKQSFGNKSELMESNLDENTKKFIAINYGPWDRLNGNLSFVDKYKKKPKGACFYPADMTKEEFEKFDNKDKTSWYTLIRRNSDNSLKIVWYKDEFKEHVTKASELLNKASMLAEDAGLKKYLELRAKALLTDDYLESDLAWMDMKNNTIDMVIGPIENYEDGLFGYKAAQSGQVLVKDKEWSDKLKKYGVLMPALQESLPVDKKYKSEKPGVDSDMNVYDVIYYAGDCNSGSKNIAINLPNDERVHAKKGSRKLQLRNAMQAKFEKIMLPISNIIITEEQRKHIKFDAFFENVMFHEVAHGLGVKKTINQKSTVRDALKDYYSPIEEAKADILGLYFVSKLVEMGEIKDRDINDNYATFFAGIFRSVRFGVSSAHGKANMITFYWFKEKGAFTVDEKTGMYKVDFEKIKEAINSLGARVLTIEGDGNYDEAKKWVDSMGKVDENLQKDLDKIAKAGIPRDIVFEQGIKVLGL